MKDLIDIFMKWNCDKGHKHHYHLIYEPQFEKKREEPINVLEIGVFKGYGAKALLEYFPNAQIYGIDIFDRVSLEKVTKFIDNDRWHGLKSDSTVAKIQEAWPDIKFDFIIDDGCHHARVQADSFKNTIDFLADDGYYWIEDCFPLHVMTASQKRHPFICDAHRQLKEQYKLEQTEYLLETIKDYNVIEHDHRKRCGTPDSYVFEITK